LAKNGSERPLTIRAIAEAQAIPPRFLELILSQLRQAGFVRSVRGAHGGYMLNVSAKELSVGEVIAFVEGPLGPVKCVSSSPDCPLYGRCPFLSLWKRAQNAMAEVYQKTSFADLVAEEAACSRAETGAYSI
jgi:Rrf2 family protein